MLWCGVEVGGGWVGGGGGGGVRAKVQRSRTTSHERLDHSTNEHAPMRVAKYWPSCMTLAPTTLSYSTALTCTCGQVLAWLAEHRDAKVDGLEGGVVRGCGKHELQAEGGVGTGRVWGARM